MHGRAVPARVLVIAFLLGGSRPVRSSVIFLAGAATITIAVGVAFVLFLKGTGLDDSKIGIGTGHDAALRALGSRWLEVLWHCLRQGVRYDESVHQANRNRALGRAA